MSIPPDIASRLRELGPGFNLPDVQALYQPLLDAQPRDGALLHADERYGPHPRQLLDVYLPTASSHTPRAVVVVFHGGGFIRGDKGQRANAGWFFARHGYVTVLPNYRLAPESTWPSGPQDVRAVVDWLNTNAGRIGADARRIVLIGESAGAAHVAAATLMQRFGVNADLGVRAVALVSGPYNARLEGLARAQFGITTPDPRNEAYFGPDTATWSSASTVDHIDAPPFPLFISYAELDLLQMQVQAGELFARPVSQHGYHPVLHVVQSHNHFSQTIAINTGDDSLSGPLLSFVARQL